MVSIKWLYWFQILLPAVFVALAMLLTKFTPSATSNAPSLPLVPWLYGEPNFVFFRYRLLCMDISLNIIFIYIYQILPGLAVLINFFCNHPSFIGFSVDNSDPSVNIESLKYVKTFYDPPGLGIKCAKGDPLKYQNIR